MADDTQKSDRNKCQTQQQFPEQAPNIANSNIFNSYSNSNYLSRFRQPDSHVCYRNARQYAQTLQCWLWQYRTFCAFNTFQSQLMTTWQPPNIYNNPNPISAAATNVPTGHQNGHVPGFAPADGIRYKVPMLWKRVAAELLDFLLLFYSKILVTVVVLRQMGYVNENLLELDDQYNFLSDLNLADMDYDRMFTFTSELIALEVVNRLCITIVETFCLRNGYAGALGGATPGKKIMKLRVVSYDDIVDAGNEQITVIGARDPGFVNALVRSIIKNFSMGFFFPACFTVFFFRFNRAAYDVLAQTIVVEEENLPQH